MVKCNYYNKNGHVALFYFIRKVMKVKHEYPFIHFYKEHHDNKMINIYASNYFYNDNSS